MRVKNFLLTALLAWGITTPALAASTIDATFPAQNSPLTSAGFRANFAAAASDVNHILGMFASATAPGAPTVGQDWLDTTATPAVWKKWTSPGGWSTIGTVNLTTGVFSANITVANIVATAPINAAYNAGVVTLSLNIDTTLAVAASNLGLNLAHANTWSVLQTFSSSALGVSTGTTLALGGASLGGYTLAVAGSGYFGSNLTIANGALLFSPDNANDIGASGATRPRSLYLGTAASIGGATIGSNALAVAGSASISGNVAAFSLTLNQNAQLFGDTANVLTMRNGASAQQFNIYNTYTDASNYEYGYVGWSGNTFILYGGAAAGTGTSRAMKLQTNGANAISLAPNGLSTFQVSGTGHFLNQTDNTYDIGAVGANRPRNLYIAGTGSFGSNVAILGNLNMTGGAGNSNISIGNSAVYMWGTQGYIASVSDGLFEFLNAAGTGATGLIIGTNDASGLRIKKSGAVFNFRVGDDSNYAPIYADVVGAATSIAITAGGSVGKGFVFSTTGNFGNFFGSGPPTLSAAQGSIYHQSDGVPAYNTNGTTGWDTLVGRTATQTITNKTLTSPTINTPTISTPTVTGGTFTSPAISGAPTITGLGTPSAASDAANKAYVDSVAAGLSIRDSVAAATTGVLSNTPVYSNGASGVGATLTGVGFAGLVIDGYTAAVNDRILVKDQVAGSNNGIYTVTATGGGAAVYILTRATDYDQSPTDIFPGTFTFVSNGTVNANNGFVMNTAAPITVGTTALSWTQFSGTGDITVDATLTKAGNQLSRAAITGDVTIAIGSNASVMATTQAAVHTWSNIQTFGSSIIYGGVGLSPSVVGTGSMVLATSPALITPALGVATATSVAIGGGSIGADALEVNGSTTHNGAVVVASASFGLSGNQSVAAWTTNGVRYKNVSGTLTDTTSSGTVATAYTDSWGGNTIAASSATTFTNYVTSYFRDPVAGSNVTLTNKWALGADSLRIGTSSQLTVSTSGVLTATNASFTTPALGVATGTSLALNGCTIGTNAFCATGTANISGAITLGGAITYGGVALSNSVIGTGSMVLSNSPTLVSPTLGAATATSINKVIFTAPATSATINMSDLAQLNIIGGVAISFTGSGSTNVTIPFGAHTMALIDLAETFTATQGFTAATSNADFGANSGNNGTVRFYGSSSGNATLKVAAAAGTPTFQLPTTNGSSGNVLQTDGAGATSWVATGAASSITVGSTTISSGTTARILYDNGGVLAEYTLTGTGTVAVMQTSPSLTTPNINVSTGTSLALNGCTIGTNAICTTGTANFSGAFTLGGALTYGGVTLSNAVVGTGNMVLSASPTFTGIPILGTPTATSLAVGGGSIGADALEVTGSTTHNGAVVIAGASLSLSGNQSAAAWTTTGIRYKNVAATFTDTTSSGTVAAAYTNVFGGSTIAASSATTYTNYFNTYHNDPVAGSNVTLTNKWAFGADSMKIGTSNQFTVSTAGAVSANTVNGNTFTTGTYTLTGTAAKTLNFTNTITLSGTDATTMTFPSVSATVAALNIEDQTLSGGANYTSKSLSTGNITVDCGARPAQYITNGGAFTITAPASDGSCFVFVANNGSAGAITFSGFTVGSNTGSALTTTNNNKFTVQVWRINGTAGYSIFAHQ